MSLCRRIRQVAAFLALLALCAPARSAARLAAQGVPSRLADTTFWRLVNELSEPGGYFQSDNFVSNETTFQWVIPELVRTTAPGGAYLGVGPDQNFPYILSLKPKIAFIFDIRRQNILTHLMYKALIEQSTDRADFLSRLFARAKPIRVDSAMRADSMLVAYSGMLADSTAMRRELAAILDRLVRTHGFALSKEDSATISYVYRSFVLFGPDITYNSNQRMGAYGRGRMPSYAQLQALSDSVGVQRGYLANEANFRALKQYESNNLIVPVVGDFAGPKAIRAVGAYLRENGLIVTAFYLSNVEQYLFNQGDDWKKFFNNVATLPLDSTSTFIRSSFTGGARGGYYGMMRSQQLLASIQAQLKLFNDGKIQWYGDVLQTSR